MKILYVAVFTAVSTNVWQACAFEKLGHEVIRYDYRQRARDLDGSLGKVNPKRDGELIKLCKTKKPDVVLYSKCNWLDVYVIKEHNKLGAVTVLWYMDNYNNINGELIEKIKECNYIFCATLSGFETAKKYNRPAFMLQGGYDKEMHYPMNLPKTRDVVFIGGLYPYRQVFKNKANFDVLSDIYNEEHSRAVSSTKINLNFTEGDGASNRIHKIMAAGGFLLTMPWKKMEEDFKVGVELDVFSTPEELQNKIDYYLKHEVERETIAKNGLQAVKRFDDLNYANKIIEAIENDL